MCDARHFLRCQVPATNVCVFFFFFNFSKDLLRVRVVDSYSQGAAGTVSTESSDDDPQRVHITTKSKPLSPKRLDRREEKRREEKRREEKRREEKRLLKEQEIESKYIYIQGPLQESFSSKTFSTESILKASKPFQVETPVRTRHVIV